MTTTDINSDNPIILRLQELEQETDSEFVFELIDIYIGEAPKQIKAIALALEAQDLTALTVAAHTLKGSSLNLGAKQLGAHCFKLEELGRSGKNIPDGVNTKEIEYEFELTKAVFLAFKQNKQ